MAKQTFVALEASKILPVYSCCEVVISATKLCIDSDDAN